LEHVLRAYPELESPRRRNFVQVPAALGRSRPLPAALGYIDSSGRNVAVFLGGLQLESPVTVHCPTHTHTHIHTHTRGGPRNNGGGA
jgi:hypothetical protein